MATVIKHPTLTLHRGGAHPEELARLEDEAHVALAALAAVLPHHDHLYGGIDLLAGALGLRCNRRRSREAREAIRRGELDHEGA